MWARNSYALLLNTRKWNKKPVKFLMSWRMEIAPPLQATCSTALPYALRKSTSHTVICHHCSSFHCTTLRSVWLYLLPNSLKVANHKLDPFLSSPSIGCTILDLVRPSSLVVSPSFPTISALVLWDTVLQMQPQEWFPKGGNGNFHQHPSYTGTQPGMRLAIGEQHWFMFTHAKT